MSFLGLRRGWLGLSLIMRFRESLGFCLLGGGFGCNL